MNGEKLSWTQSNLTPVVPVLTEEWCLLSVSKSVKKCSSLIAFLGQVSVMFQRMIGPKLLTSVKRMTILSYRTNPHFILMPVKPDSLSLLFLNSHQSVRRQVGAFLDLKIFDKGMR